MGTTLSKRFLVMYLLCLDVSSLGKAHLAERMGISIAVTYTFPRSAVPSFHCRVTVVLFITLVFFFLVLFTEPPVSKVWSAREGTRSFWFSRHHATSCFWAKKKPHEISLTRLRSFSIFHTPSISQESSLFVHDFTHLRVSLFSHY